MLFAGNKRKVDGCLLVRNVGVGVRAHVYALRILRARAT
jgi:hypothetical protein